ncbi:MAG: hypothetical protein U1E56_01075 [Bauldia sp.]
MRLLLTLLAGVSPFAVSAALAQVKADPYAAPAVTGPSSKTVEAVGATKAASGAPYILPTAPGWSATSLLTTGDAVKGYALAGIPDGVGLFDNGDRTLTVLINHEIGSERGAVRGHGGKGAFVSRWTLNKDTLEVTGGRDFVDSAANLHLYDRKGERYVAASALVGTPEAKLLDLTRLCSADLAAVSAFYNAASGKGYNGRIFLNGEEGGNGNANRAFAWIVGDASAWELPAFGFGTTGDNADPPPSWENVVANPASGDATVVMANSDGGTNQIYLYLGAKQASGSPIERAGLANGRLWSIAVAGIASEDRASNIGIAKSLAGKGGGKRVALAAPNRGTSFLRPEDGAWDPRNPNRYYFVTTDRNNFAADGTAREGQDVTQVGRSRLWSVTFDDVTRIAPEAASVGTIELLLDGTEGGDMFDNITVDRAGRITLNEDTGNARHNAKMWQYDTESGAFAPIFKFDPAKFGDVVNATYSAPTAPFTDDKETSGVIDASEAFADAAWFRPGSQALLTVVQAHFAYDAKEAAGAALVEGGQLLLLTRPP